MSRSAVERRQPPGAGDTAVSPCATTFGSRSRWPWVSILIDTYGAANDHRSVDRHLAGQGLRFEGVIIGGAALALMGVVSRLTKDVDVLVPALPEAISRAARDFAEQQREAGNDVVDEWLNNGPTQLGDALPDGWRDRVEPLFAGDALVFRVLGRADLLKSKLFALADRGIDLEDCIALAPTTDELAECLPWLEQQDGNEEWPVHVRGTLAALGRRLGHAV